MILVRRLWFGVRSSIINNQCSIFNLFSLCTLYLILGTSFSYSQSITANAILDTNVIRIGEQTKLHLQITHPKNLSVQFPFIPDTLSKIEFINKSKIDTVSSDANTITRKQDISITAWDSGFFVITPFVFTYKQPNDTNDYTAETQPLLLTTNIIPVDTTLAIKDITAPIAVGISWREILPYALTVVAILLIVALIYYLKKRKVPLAQIIVPKVPVKPAHEIAFEELNNLKEEKLWQQGYIKQYHTRITEIIRSFIGRRYQMDALEMTTEDILSHSQINHLKGTNYEQVKYLLQLADLAKFAKAQPLAVENEQALASAYSFVEDTKEIVVAPKDKKEAQHV